MERFLHSYLYFKKTLYLLFLEAFFAPLPVPHLSPAILKEICFRGTRFSYRHLMADSAFTRSAGVSSGVAVGTEQKRRYMVSVPTASQ